MHTHNLLHNIIDLEDGDVDAEHHNNSVAAGSSSTLAIRRFSSSLGNKLKSITSKLTGTSLHTTDVSHEGLDSADDQRMAGDAAAFADIESPIMNGSVPQYWVGYNFGKYSNVQPWQSLLLPMIFGSEEAILEISQQTEDINTVSHDINEIIGSKKNRSKVCAECGKNASLCQCCDIELKEITHAPSLTDMSIQNSAMFVEQHQITPLISKARQNDLSDWTKDPQQLYLRSDMDIMYRMLQRESDLFSVEVLDDKKISLYTNRDFSCSETATLTTTTMSGADMDTTKAEKDLNELLIATLPIENLPSSSRSISVNNTTDPSIRHMSSAEENMMWREAIGSPNEYLSAPPSIANSRSGSIHGSSILKLQSSIVLESQRCRSVYKFLYESSWVLHEKNTLWQSSDTAWHCRKCALQFSLFQRKHHCRRCGGIFCNEHVPLVDASLCIPNSYIEV